MGSDTVWHRIRCVQDFLRSLDGRTSKITHLQCPIRSASRLGIAADSLPNEQCITAEMNVTEILSGLYSVLEFKMDRFNRFFSNSGSKLSIWIDLPLEAAPGTEPCGIHVHLSAGIWWDFHRPDKPKSIKRQQFGGPLRAWIANWHTPTSDTNRFPALRTQNAQIQKIKHNLLVICGRLNLRYHIRVTSFSTHKKFIITLDCERFLLYGCDLKV